MARDEVDWGAIRAAYEVGGATPDEISRLFGVRRTLIVAHIEDEGWVSSSLSRQLRVQTEAALLRADGQANVRPQDIENAAAFNAQLIRDHRVLITRSRATVDRLMQKLEAALAADLTGVSVIFERLVTIALSTNGLQHAAAEGIPIPSDRDIARLRGALTLGEHTGISKELVNTLKLLIEMERKAHYIPDAAPTTQADDLPHMSEVTPENAASVYARMIG